MQVRVEPCDAGDASATAALLSSIAEGGVISGIVHCAGVLADRRCDETREGREA